MFIGPVFTREAAVTPRRSKFYVYRAVYVAALFLLMCTAWLVLAGTQVIASVGDMARFGASIFHILAPIQLCLVIFFAAFSAAGAVAQEKDRKTLILLLMTRLNNSELVLGKMLASLINVFALIMAAAPVFCALFLFGGVSAGQVFRVLLVTFITALAAGSIGSTIALWREKTFQTLALVAMLITVLLGFSVVVSQRVLFDRLLGISAADWATAINPIWAVMEAANPFPTAEGNLAMIGGVIGLHVLIMSLGIVIMNGIAIGLVRVWNPSREARRGKEMEAKQLEESIWGAEHDMAKMDAAADQNTANEQRRSGHVDARTTEVKIDHRQVWENPILWRETQTWAYGRKVLIIKFVYLALAVAATYMLYSMVAAGTAVYRGDQLGTTIPPIAWGIVPLYLISLVIVNALAVTSVTNERDGQALDLLLVTDLTPKEFTFGKLWGVMWVTREMILAPLAVTAYLWIAGAMQLDSFLFVSAGLVTMYFFVTMLGLHCGMTYANSRTAIGVSLGTVFFLFLGVITCILLMISFTESFHFQLFPFLGFVAGGGLGLYVAIGYRNPSNAILMSTLLLPGISFFAIVSFLLGKGFEVAFATVLAYGFTTLTMLIPAISQFDIEVGRRSGNDEDQSRRVVKAQIRNNDSSERSGGLDVIVAIAPWLVAMLLLVACSGMFSASEAAFFYLKLEDRKRFRKGTTAQRAAASLLSDPDRLLSAILFWNLMVNVAFFAVASIVGLRLQDTVGSTYATIFSTVSLLVIIFFSEMLPKSLAVLRAPALAALLAVPIAFAVRVIDPIRPIMRGVSTLSQRLIWPRFEAEPYMQVSDLERAIQMSMQSSTVLEQEEMALRGIVSLSDSQAQEMMRPRMRFKMFHPPVTLKDLDAEMTPSGYLLISDEQGDDVVSAINLIDATELPASNLEEHAQEVLVFPWCAKASEVFQQMMTTENEVAAVVNELGETIGVITLRDMMETIFSYAHGRSERILQRKTFEEQEDGSYLISGMTSVRRLAKHFGLDLPETRHATINGILQEELERIPEVEDVVEWGPFEFEVIEQHSEGHILVRLTMRQEEE